MIAGTFAGFYCEKCGKIPMSEFPQDVRSKAVLGSVALIVIALALLVGVIVLLVHLDT